MVNIINKRLINIIVELTIYASFIACTKISDGKTVGNNEELTNYNKKITNYYEKITSYSLVFTPNFIILL